MTDKSGEGGIRTPGPVTVNGFQDRRIRPLCHLSAANVQLEIIQSKINMDNYLNGSYPTPCTCSSECQANKHDLSQFYQLVPLTTPPFYHGFL
jgi:hypothetical protein